LHNYSWFRTRIIFFRRWSEIEAANNGGSSEACGRNHRHFGIAQHIALSAFISGDNKKYQALDFFALLFLVTD